MRDSCLGLGHVEPSPRPGAGHGQLGCAFITWLVDSPNHSDASRAGCPQDWLKVGPKVSHRRGAVVGCGDVSFRWVLEPLAGAEGREVRAAQARAIRELARWLTENEKGQMDRAPH